MKKKGFLEILSRVFLLIYERKRPIGSPQREHELEKINKRDQGEKYE